VVDLPLAALRARELLPFEASVAAGASTIMSSHILLPQLDADNPATFSRLILDDLLRRDLGFDGVIVSDALDMVGASGVIGIPEAAVRAIAAGCDLLCIGTENTDAQLDDIERALDAAVSDGRLDGARLAAAAARNVALALRLSVAPVVAPADPRFPLERSIAAFAVAPGVSPSALRTVVAIDTAANIAVGDSPWGPPVDARLAEGDPLPAVRGQLVIVGKNNHRHDWVRSLVDDARRAHPTTVVVDMGWPDTDRHYADVATFGASRHVSQALAVWLEGETP